jgi:hypothetical protein
MESPHYGESGQMKQQIKKTPDYRRFEDALRTVLRDSHSDLKADLDAEKKAKKQRRSKHAPASPGSDAQR